MRLTLGIQRIWESSLPLTVVFLEASFGPLYFVLLFVVMDLE